MKTLCMSLFLAAVVVSFPALAGAAIYQTGQVLSVTHSQPAPACCSAGTDAPLQAEVWNYDLRVRVGAELYHVDYATALNYFPSDLVSGANVGVRVARHHVDLETREGPLETNVVSKHLDKSAAY